MRIKQLEIYGYGKWVDQTFDLVNDVQLFYGANEAGKSTLMSFIHSILFGFPTRNSTLLRYEPHESSKYGGKIMAEDPRFGQVVIERVHGKVTGNVTVTLEDGTTGADELLDTLLSGMTRETFQNIFSFSLSDIENVHQLNKNQLNRYLLNIGAHGTDDYLDYIDEFKKEADKLYRPTGRVLPLNQQLATLENQEKRLGELEARNESYLDLIEENNRQLIEMEQLEKNRDQVEKRLADVLEIKKEWHIYEEIKTLQASIRKTNLPPLKEDGHYLFEEYKKECSKINEQLQEINLAITQQKETLTNPEMMQQYEQHQQEITELEQALPEMMEQLGDYQFLSNQQTENQKQLLLLNRQLKREQNTTEPVVFTEVEKENVQEWLVSHEQLEEKLVALQIALQKLENELNLKNQQLDQIEAIMWDSETLRSIEDELATEESIEKAPEEKPKKSYLLSGGLALFALLASFFVQPPIQWVTLGLGLLSLAGTFLLFVKRDKKKLAPNKEPSAFMVQEYEKQSQLKEQWRDLLGEIDSVQAHYQEQLKIKESYLHKQRLIKDHWQALLREHKLSEYLDFIEATQIIEQSNTLLDRLHKNKKVQQTLNERAEALKPPTDKISKLLELPEELSFSEKIARFRTYLSKLQLILNDEASKMEKLSALRQEKKQLVASKQNTQNKMITLIETAGAKDEAAFFDLYKQKEALDAKKSRLLFLKENAPSFNEENELPTKEELKKKEAKLREDLQVLAEQNKAALRESANTQLSIERLEEDGTYTEELQNFENQKATAQHLVDEWVSNKVAAGILRETLNQVTQDRFEEILFDAETYFNLLTEEKYEKIVFKNEELFVQHRKGRMEDVRVLSRGTAEPLYVAIRLAYIKNTQKVMELPVIMDDPFVNFDSTRQKNMYQLMQYLGKDLQIIYFTFDPSVHSQFEVEQITNLKDF
ncbi:Uncharacterized protein YhaN [Atopostipes suicloacalis DSM 15692]|uniref:Uncharacterized protein YhaN n=1 Tax=Atopostipes suicloacalis DSM 15692 TaxID=1121025 RepID=A0A1M4XB59_9LACT|nr:AAA family ATPase [Atopostipes suicloacalis]SHE90747.1 Uncharacterized protein YhaN [Atopostipes suicloacalis DSM 15692]